MKQVICVKAFGNATPGDTFELPDDAAVDPGHWRVAIPSAPPVQAVPAPPAPPPITASGGITLPPPAAAAAAPAAPVPSAPAKERS